MFKAPGNIFNNWDKDLYIAQKKEVTYDDYNNEIVIYSEPFYFGRINYQPLTGKNLESHIRTFGETKNKIVSCLIDLKDKDKISEFDLAYLYGNTPEGEKVNGDNANYIVRTHRLQNTKVMIVMEEIIKEENNGNSKNSR